MKSVIVSLSLSHSAHEAGTYFCILFFFTATVESLVLKKYGTVILIYQYRCKNAQMTLATSICFEQILQKSNQPSLTSKIFKYIGMMRYTFQDETNLYSCCKIHAHLKYLLIHILIHFKTLSRGTYQLIQAIKTFEKQVTGQACTYIKHTRKERADCV